METPSIREVTADEPSLLPGLCELLRDSVHGGASVGFLAPLSQERALEYWREVMASLGASLRLWVAEEGDYVVGAVQLSPCLKENGRHRADLQKLFVHGTRQGRRIASSLLTTVETSAAESGISLLVLDTLRGSPAERVYAHLRWQRAGEIPGYAASPEGVLHPTVLFYKFIPA